MKLHKARIATLAAVLLFAAVLFTVNGCKKTEVEKTEPKEETAVPENVKDDSHETTVAPAALPNLVDIVKNRRTWNPVFSGWYGEEMPDFSATDLNGNVHKLSELRGKNVMLSFGTTWCPPCTREIPYLIALRNTFSEEELGLWWISNENQFLLSDYVNKTKINYTVLRAYSQNLPSPFNRVETIPTAFFIDAEGKLKIAISGMAHFQELQAILKAKGFDETDSADKQ